MQLDEKLGEADTSTKPNRAALAPNGTSDAKRASRASKQPTNSKLHGRNFELKMESNEATKFTKTCDELQIAPNADSRSIGIERCTPKFLKNWETQLFQKLAGVGSRRLIPSCVQMNATWYK